MDPGLVQLLVAVLAIFGTGGAVSQLVGLRREKRAGAPLDETAARLDIVKQLERIRAELETVEHERDEANGRAAAAGRRADTADARADVYERYASDLREDCLAHGTALSSLRPRPTFVGAPA